MVAASMGWASRLSMAAAGTAIGSYAEAHEILSESMQAKGEIADTNGIRGTRSHASERTAAGVINVGGQLNYAVDPVILDLLLPRILGADEATNVFALTDALPTFDLLIDRITKRFVYTGCYVNKATFKGQQGSKPIDLTLDILAKAESAPSATAFPTITAPSAAPYVFSQGVLTLVGSSRQILDFEVTIDNALQARFANSQTATDISPTDRIVTIKCTTPFTSTEYDLYNQTLLGSAASLVITNGSLSTTFTFGKIQFPAMSPVVAGKQEIPLTLEGIARMTSTTRELVVTNVSA